MTEREKFEDWAVLGSEPYDLTMTERGYYLNEDTLSAWYGWQARAALDKETYPNSNGDLEVLP